MKKRCGPLDKNDQSFLSGLLSSISELRIHRRVQAVMLVAEGFTASEAGRIVGMARESVQRWVSIYRRRRSGGCFVDRRRSGRPRTHDRVSARTMRAILNRSPLELGYMSTVWTVALLTTHLSEHYGHRLSQHSVRRRLKELGYRWKRARHRFNNTDPDREQKKGGSEGASGLALSAR